MKTETLELLIEELASALTLERWRNQSAENKIRALEAEIIELKNKENNNG